MPVLDLHYLELTERTRRIHATELPPVEATRAQLARIERFDKQLSSYTLALPELALEQARQAEAEIHRPLAFQFMATPFAEDLLCCAGFAYQQATDWHRRHPELG